jgi:predicted naringenin-chalcone synthase
MMSTVAYINRIGTALPKQEAHASFLAWAEKRIEDRRVGTLFKRMAGRSGIEQRWTVLSPPPGSEDAAGPGGFYADPQLPPTSDRMRVYAEEAPRLAIRAIEALGGHDGITHLVVASCTGFIAPGIDQIIARELGLDAGVERTLVGFMGCYAAVSALRLAHHLVRSEPAARVLVVTVELCTLHLQPDVEIEPILAMLLFGDGAAAALVTADPTGFALDKPFAVAVPDSEDLIRWTVGDKGFAMHLSGAVPTRIGLALADPAVRARIGDTDSVDCWAVHAGGRTVLDAVEQGMGLDGHALDASREILRTCGNMSSATLMFVLRDLLASGQPAGNGLAIAFGPGLAAEGFRFRRAG